MTMKDSMTAACSRPKWRVRFRPYAPPMRKPLPRRAFSQIKPRPSTIEERLKPNERGRWTSIVMEAFRSEDSMLPAHKPFSLNSPRHAEASSRVKRQRKPLEPDATEP